MNQGSKKRNNNTNHQSILGELLTIPGTQPGISCGCDEACGGAGLRRPVTRNNSTRWYYLLVMDNFGEQVGSLVEGISRVSL